MASFPYSLYLSPLRANLLPFSSEEVVSWFEDNAGETDIPAEVAALKKVGEEDNPVGGDYGVGYSIAITFEFHACEVKVSWAWNFLLYIYPIKNDS